MNNISFQKKLCCVLQQYASNIAIEYGDNTLTYKMLDIKSSYIAACISKRGIKAGSFIGIYVKDRACLITTILGILKAGCVFVTLDTSYPSKRLEKMIRKAELQIILTDDENKLDITTKISEKETDIIEIKKEIDYHDKNNMNDVEVEYDPEAAIYVYFTSGTTGMPKAIVGKNKSLLHFINWEIETFQIDESYRIGQFTNPGFDPFLRDVFVALFAGGTICIPSDENLIMDSEALTDWIDKKQITLIHCVPSIFKLFNTQKTEYYKHLNYVLLHGEKIPLKELEKWYKTFGERIQLVNIYGPTETTLAKMYHRISRVDIEKGVIPVGKPIQGARVIILDKDMHVCGREIVGEVYIRTPYRTLGYYKDDELNASKFIMNPYNNDPEDLLYRTGDMGRLLQDDNIELVGRMDSQVKIRGVRIELSEIEDYIQMHPLVNESVVIAKTNSQGEKYLSAYYVSREQLEEDELRDYLVSQLSDYMVPSFFIQIDKIPLSLNGKINRTALPEPAEYMVSQQLPTDEIELKIAHIWSDILELELNKIGVNSNFFMIGGHSLKATVLSYRIKHMFHIEMSIGEIFRRPTLKLQGEYIRHSHVDKDSILQVAEKKAYYPLSSAQKRLYILEELEGQNITYNITNIMEIYGDIDKDKIESTFQALINRHESLRTSFIKIKNEVYQKIHQNMKMNLAYLEADDHTLEEIIRVFIQPFNLAEGPLFRVGLIKAREGKYLLIMDVHHIISDGISQEILARDFMTLFKGGKITALDYQYKDYTEWQNSTQVKEKIKKQEAYWLKALSEIPILNLPTDCTRPSIQSTEGDYIVFNLGESVTEALYQLAQQNNTTLFMVLLSMFNIFLSKLSHQETILVGTPIAGRRLSSTEDIIGNFVNTLPIKTHISPKITYKEFLQEVTENALEVFDHQDYQFDDLVSQIAINRDMSRHPIFDVMFAMQNIDIEKIECDGMIIKPYSYKNPVAKFDLSLCVEEQQNDIVCCFEYCTKLFYKKTIERMIEYFKHTLHVLLENTQIEISDISLLSTENRKILLEEYKGAHIDFPHDQTIVDMFEAQVGHRPDHIAVICDEYQLTYKELNEKANKLARLLRDKGIEKNGLVAILCERSADMLVGILGVFKAGGAYIPIDASYPMDRIKDLLDDSHTKMLLTTSDAFHDSLALHERISSSEDIKDIVYLDRLEDLDKHNAMMNTLRLADRLSKGRYNTIPRSLSLQYNNQSLTGEACLEHVGKILANINKNNINLGTKTIIMLANPIYKIISIQLLHVLHIPHLVVDYRMSREDKKRIIHDSQGVSIISESALLDDVDAILWELSEVRTYLLMDNYDYTNDKKDSDLKDLWNYVAHKTTYEVNDYGWSNSYNGESFTIEEMNEYVTNFETKLKPLLKESTRVLEIGCGHGIVASKIAPEVGYYLGTDLSAVIVERNNERAKKEGITNIQYKTASANQLSHLEDASFDLVICSSVIHYFPNTLYLEKVIKSAIDRIEHEGYIYLDDMLDLRKKHDFIESIRCYKENNKAAQSKLNWESDLFVHDDFFHDMEQKYPEISKWEKSKKIGSIKNELTNYRYDVLIKIDKHTVKRKEGKCLHKHRVSMADMDSIAKNEPITLNDQSQMEMVDRCHIMDITTINNYDHNNLLLDIDGCDLAYVIYTSGSTGKPKGAMVEHLGMMNHILAKINDLQLSDKSVIAQNASHTFDISVWQFLSALMVGGKTIIYPYKLILDPKRFLYNVIENQITILEVVPSYLEVILDSVNNAADSLDKIEYLLVTGEIVKPELVKKWFKKYPQIKMVNAYGPTEASDDITHYIMETYQESRSVSIGKPIQNTTIYIVDNDQKLCPVGVLGEIWVSGIGVGRGYLHDDEKTSKAFIEDPFSEESGIRLYKTGDLGRWLEVGNIEFFGRKDHQVKIRGHRIELGEIESILLSHNHVKAAVVIDGQDKGGEKYLCAYVTLSREVEINEIRSFLAKELPSYMVPNIFQILDVIPLTANGKVDRKRLPLPTTDSHEMKAEEKSELEEKLINIWGKVLEVDSNGISLNSNFFELGGHSLKVNMLVSMIYKELNVKVPLMEIFRLPNVRDIAKYIQESSREAYKVIVPVAKKERYPMSSAQKRLYIIHQMDPESVSYNIPQVVWVEGDLNINRLESVFQQLIRRHESLRTSFEMKDDKLYQKVHESNTFKLEYHESTKKEVGAIITNFIKPFNLAIAPLLRVGVIRISNHQHILITDIHHIITDDISQIIFMKEFMALMNDQELQEQKIQYKDYSEWQYSSDYKGMKDDARSYWLSKLKGKITRFQLPTDFPLISTSNFEGEKVFFEINHELMNKIKSIMASEEVTLNIVFLAAYHILLHKYVMEEDIIIGMPVTGRKATELHDVVGLFVNMIAIRNHLHSKMTFRDFLHQVKESALQAYENSDYPFDDLIQDLGLYSKDGRNPLFDAVLAIQTRNNDLELDKIHLECGITLRPYDFQKNRTKFAILLGGIEIKNGMNMHIEYMTALFKRKTMETMAKRYVNILEQVLMNWEVRLGDINIYNDVNSVNTRVIEQMDDEFDFL